MYVAMVVEDRSAVQPSAALLGIFFHFVKLQMPAGVVLHPKRQTMSVSDVDR